MSALQLTGQKRLSAVLLITASALLALLVWEWQQGLALRDSVLALKTRQAATPPALKLEQPFRLRNAADYARITEQPLFVASRTPAKQETSTTTKPPEQFELTGVAQTPKEVVVLLRNVKTGKTERLKEGEKTNDGLEIQSVKPDGVIIKQHGQDVSLDLHVALSSDHAAASTTPAAPASAPTSTTPAAPASAPTSTTPTQNIGAPSVMPKKEPTPPAAEPGLQKLNALRATMGLPALP